jgi:ubiquinone/menaquinone biosynthesis C-methylase UbiE
MYLPMKLVLKDATKDFMTFKDSIYKMTKDEFSQLYERTLHVQELQGETDLNDACRKEILKIVKGSTVLEVGCGRGLLAKQLAKKNKVTACDIVIPENLKKSKDGVKYIEANIDKLPFKDKSFDVVISTHTLEHVQNTDEAMSELRRVARKTIIIVVPRQRPYKYTFSLHTHFFPYSWSLQAAFGNHDAEIKKLGDWLYIEKVSSKNA